MLEPQVVLAIGAHTDDIELGCGATLSKFAQAGVQIHTVAFSRAELSRPDGTPIDVLEKEYRRAMAELGLPEENVHCHALPVRTFSNYRQQVLDTLIRARSDIEPDLVLTMGRHDTHQDHEVVAAESVRAFRNRTMLTYASPWNQRSVATNCFVEVTRRDLEVKKRMLSCYSSQASLSRPYMEPEAIESTLRFYGLQSGLELAEAFEIYSMRDGAPRK